jgi:hypothetical protein
MSSTKRFAIALAVASLFAFGANAQQSSGNIAGNAVAGDTVEIKGADTGFRRELSIKEDGKYQVRAVPAGAYVVTVTHADGSAETPKGINVRVGSTARVK